VIVIDTDAAERELDRVRLAEQGHPRGGKAAHGRAIPRRDVAAEQPRAGRRREPFHVVEIFRRIRDAVQRPEVVTAAQQRLRRARFGQHAIAGHRDERVEALVQRGDAIEERLRELHRAHGPGADLRGQLGHCRELERRVGRHGAQGTAAGGTPVAALKGRSIPIAKE
jgi:hypothetical protein